MIVESVLAGVALGAFVVLVVGVCHIAKHWKWE